MDELVVTEIADLVYVKNGPRGEISLKVTTSNQQHIGTGELKGGYIGPNDVTERQGNLTFNNWNDFLYKECTVEMTRRANTALRVQFLVNGRSVAVFQARNAGVAPIEYTSPRPEFMFTNV